MDGFIYFLLGFVIAGICGSIIEMKTYQLPKIHWECSMTDVRNNECTEYSKIE